MHMNPAPALAPATKTDYVYQTIRGDILAGRLPPGQRLRLTELADRYAISQMPVREALRKLEHDGLVEFENHRGATVSDLTLDRIVEIIATRTYLEVFAVIEAMPHHTQETIEQLNALLEKMKRTKQPAQYSDLNRKFHRLLSDPCPNAFLKSEIEQLWNKVWRTRTQSLFQMVPDRIDAATDEHAEILRALVARRGDKLQNALMAHRSETLAHWTNLAGTQRSRAA